MKNNYPIVHWDVKQRSQQWLNLKNGKMSASRASDLIGTPLARKKYIQMKAVESLRLPPVEGQEGGISAAMRRGIELEPYAVEAINKALGLQNRECGYIELADWFGISPDWINMDMTVAIEIKCLEPNSQAEVVLSEATNPLDAIPKKHRGQVLSYFLIPDVRKVAYVIFVPREELISGRDYLHFIWLNREDFLDEIEDLRSRVYEGCALIKKYLERL